MTKKRKLQANSEGGASPELDLFEKDSVEEEPATILPGEVPDEGSSAPETGQPIEDESLIKEEPKDEAIEASNPAPDPDHSAVAPATDVTTDVTPDGTAAGDEGDEDENDPAFLHKLLEPFSKEQLLSLLHDAALKHPDLRDSIRRTADVDPSHRKVFVHGLGWNTTAETLTSIFRQYGEIEDCKSVVNRLTGKSKGYGFILFKHRSGARRALKEPLKQIGSRMAACQLASTGPAPALAPTPVLPVTEYTQRKIYVSNVGPDLDPQKLLQFFSNFGEIEEGPLGLDKATGKPKGFCLFVYKSPEGAKKALEEPNRNFDGHILHCQKAIDGPKPNRQEIHHLQGGMQYASLHHGQSGITTRGPQVGRMGGPSPSIGGHLIAPSASSGFNHSGLVVNNGVHALKPTFGHHVAGAGFPRASAMGGFAVPQVQVGYGGAAMGHGVVRPQQGFVHINGVGPYMGQ